MGCPWLDLWATMVYVDPWMVGTLKGPSSYIPTEARGQGGLGPLQGGAGGAPTRNRQGGPFFAFFAHFWRFLPI